ncbi:MAG: hypothetical protein KDB88_12060, partial [Flavobacteriales bacterium]|nr:hypothetical protein [Flavobacteriales bacterium]
MQRNTTTLWGLLLGAVLQAQAPYRTTYQAVVRDANGDALANTTVAFRLSIREGSNLGTIRYQERQTATTNDHGLATLSLGGGTVLSGAMDDVQWQADLHYLQVEVDTSGGTNYVDLGADQLLSVPYSLYANEGPAISDATLDGLGIRGDTLRLGQQGADSSNVLMWDGLTWIPVDIDILIGGSSSITNHNTLDAAYDEGGDGAGRTIVASHGPVRVHNSGDNIGLLVEDSLNAGDNTFSNVLVDYGGTKYAVDIEHTRHGTGLLVKNDSTDSNTALNSVEIFNAGHATGLPTDANGRALLARTINRKNPRPTIEGYSLGLGHGVLGVSGPDDWGSDVLKFMRSAGVAGYSGTNDVGTAPSGSDGAFDVQGFRRGRVGVAGLSRRSHGVWGSSNIEGSFHRQSIDSIVAGVVGQESAYLAGNTQNVARYDHFGVAGLAAEKGSGILGIGAGHGIVGLGGTKETATSAGVWGSTRYASWPLTQAEYPLVQTD